MQSKFAECLLESVSSSRPPHKWAMAGTAFGGRASVRVLVAHRRQPRKERTVYRESSQAIRSVSRFHRGGLLFRSEGSACSSALRLVSRFACA